jgi:molybdopterin converting factor small subunit
MSDISEFERRITAALDRAQQALEQLSAGEGGDTVALTAELDAERVANQQLEERVRAIKEKQETTVAELEGEVARLQEALKARDGEVQSMRSVNETLRASNTALREANAQGLAEPELVNAAMVTELDGLRAARAAERAEIEEILATLEPALKEA